MRIRKFQKSEPEAEPNQSFQSKLVSAEQKS